MVHGEGSSGRSQLHGQHQEKQRQQQQQQLHDSSKGIRRSLQSGGGATKQGAAARTLWASGDGQAVGATVSASGGVAVHCTYNQNLEGSTTRVPLAGGGVPECLSHVVDVSTGSARWGLPLPPSLLSNHGHPCCLLPLFSKPLPLPLSDCVSLSLSLPFSPSLPLSLFPYPHPHPSPLSPPLLLVSPSSS